MQRLMWPSGPLIIGSAVRVGNTTTVPAGSNANVRNVGTPFAPVLDFDIPRGANGTGGDGTGGGEAVTGVDISPDNVYASGAVTAAGDVTAAGAVTAGTFVWGNGYHLTSLRAANVGFWSEAAISPASVTSAGTVRADALWANTDIRGSGFHLSNVAATDKRLYVSTWGADSGPNDGSMLRPYRSIRKACEVANAMSNAVTIFVETGEYTEDNPIWVKPGTAIIGDNLRRTRLYATRANADYFHLGDSNYLWGLRFINMKRPAFCAAFPCSIADCDVSGGQVSNPRIVHSYSGYTAPPTVYVTPPENFPNDPNAVPAVLTATVLNGNIAGLVIVNPGSGYVDRPHISIHAPEPRRPIIMASPYVQNCSSITGPFDTQGELISRPLPYDVNDVNGNGSGRRVDEEGAGGGIRIDGAVCNVASPLRSFVADAFTQVNQGGPGHLIVNKGYAQFVSCFTTFCSYSFKALSGSTCSISNSVTDFGKLGLVARGYWPDPYLRAKVSLNYVRAVKVVNGGAGYTAVSNVVVTGAQPTPVKLKNDGVDASVVVEGGMIVEVDIKKPVAIHAGYTVQTATVTFEAPAGSGVSATALADLTSGVNSITVRDLGAGYTQASTTVQITGGGGAGATANATVENGQVTKITVLRKGIGYTSQPVVSVLGANTLQANANVTLTGIGAIPIVLTATDRPKFGPPDYGSIVNLYGVFYRVLGAAPDANVVPANAGYTFDASKLYTVTAYRVGGTTASPPYAANNAEMAMHYASAVGTGSHVMEYVGSGVTYNALPEYGGSPNQGAEAVNTEPGKVFYATVDHLGNYRIGKTFAVDQATGDVTITSDRFNLAGLNSIGPFKRGGVAVGVRLEEVSDNDSLTSSAGSAESTVVPSQKAVMTYVDRRAIPSAGIKGAVLAKSSSMDYQTAWTTNLEVENATASGRVNAGNLEGNGWSISNINPANVLTGMDNSKINWSTDVDLNSKNVTTSGRLSMRTAHVIAGLGSPGYALLARGNVGGFEAVRIEGNGADQGLFNQGGAIFEGVGARTMGSVDVYGVGANVALYVYADNDALDVTGNMKLAGNLTTSGRVNAANLEGNGWSISNINPANVLAGLDNAKINWSTNANLGTRNLATSGRVNAANLEGNGWSISNINPANVLTGLDNSKINWSTDVNLGTRNLATSGRVNAANLEGNGWAVSNLNAANLVVTSWVDKSIPQNAVNVNWNNFAGAGTSVDSTQIMWVNPVNIGASNLMTSGNVVARNLQGNGWAVDNLNPANLQWATINTASLGAANLTTSGRVNAANLEGNGWSISNINPANVLTGLDNSKINWSTDVNLGTRNLTTSGRVTAASLAVEAPEVNSSQVFVRAANILAVNAVSRILSDTKAGAPFPVCISLTNADSVTTNTAYSNTQDQFLFYGNTASTTGTRGTFGINVDASNVNPSLLSNALHVVGNAYVQGNVIGTGVMSAVSIIGNGFQLTGLNAASLLGNIENARINWSSAVGINQTVTTACLRSNGWLVANAAGNAVAIVPGTTASRPNRILAGDASPLCIALTSSTSTVDGSTTYTTGQDAFVFQKDATRGTLAINPGVTLPTTANALHVVGNAFVQGDIYATGDITAFSDSRLKSNLRVIGGSLEKIDKLTGYTYERVDLGGARAAGLLAQDVQGVLPEAVKPHGQYLGVTYGSLTGLLVEAIKELAQENKALKREVADIKRMLGLDALRTEVAGIKKMLGLES